jgi:hypothetical protein
VVVVVVVAIAVVIVVIPIAFRTPAMLVFIPPSMTGAPAVLPRLVEFMTPAFGLRAMAAMMLNGFVQPVVGARNPALAIVAIGAQKRRSSEHQKPSQRGCSKRRFSEEQIVQSIWHKFCGLPLQCDLCNASFISST